MDKLWISWLNGYIFKNALSPSDQTNSDIAKGVITAFFGALAYAFQSGKDSLNAVIEEQREALMALNARLKLTDLLPPDFMNGLTEMAKTNLATHASHELIKLVTHNILDAGTFAGLAAHHFAILKAEKNVYQLLVRAILSATAFQQQDEIAIHRINSIAPFVLEGLETAADDDFKAFITHLNESQAQALKDELTLIAFKRQAYDINDSNSLNQIRAVDDTHYHNYIQTLQARVPSIVIGPPGI